MRFISALLLVCFAWGGSMLGQTNGVSNSGFELGLENWNVWSRANGAIQAKVVADSAAPEGTHVIQISHNAESDWSLEPKGRIAVQAGDIFELSVAGTLQGTGSGTICVSLWDAQNQNKGWAYGGKGIAKSTTWKRVKTRLVIPDGIEHIQPRFIGNGPANVQLDDYVLTFVGNIRDLKTESLPETLTLGDDSFSLTFDTTKNAVQVRYTQPGKAQPITRKQLPATTDLVILDATTSGDTLRIKQLHIPSGLELQSTLRIIPNKREYSFTLTGQGELPVSISYPSPFEAQTGATPDYLVIPMNEGISYPVTDTSIDPLYLIGYGGHGICMGFWGATSGQEGYAAIIETPDDMGIKIDRIRDLLTVNPVWEAQLGKFGYERRLRYVFFDQGGHVAIAKRYREYALEKGLVKTLREKEKEIPATARLAGAVNVWCWDGDKVKIVEEMQAAGIEHILWSSGADAKDLKTLNEKGVLTSRYDIYQDVMNPDNFPSLTSTHGDWVTPAWPDQIIIDANGNWRHGWGVKGKDGKWYDCGVICDRFSPEYAAKRIPAELSTKPYLARFIDTTTASPWQECYHPDHPMTRTQSREWKMKLLDYISGDLKLVTGCETGHDASVPYLHFFEGMMSLGPYRVPDSGRDMMREWNEVPERVEKFQLGHRYRLPLWELVYHDCTVSYWYWGDYNNKLPSLWDKRDLFNVLYGVPPMFMFNKERWNSKKDRFVQSYQNTCPIIRKIAFESMVNHEFLTPDRDVQRTTFSNGTRITVNFGDKPFGNIQPHGYSVHENP